jgi:site-specific recombinase XerD
MKRPRRSAVYGLESLALADNTAHAFMSANCHKPPKKGASDIEFAMDLTYQAMSGGISLEVMICAWVHLDWKRLKAAVDKAIETKLCPLILPVHHKDLRNEVATLWLSPANLRRLKRWYANHPNLRQGGGDAYILYPEISGKSDVELMKMRYAAIKNNLQAEHKKRWRSWTGRKGHTFVPLTQLSQALYNAYLLTSRMPPALAFARQKLPLPVGPSPASPDLIAAYLNPQPPIQYIDPVLIHYDALKALGLSLEHAEPLPDDEESSEPEIALAVTTAQDRLREISRNFVELFGKRKVKERDEKRLRALNDAGNEWLIESVFEEGSVARLGLMWVIDLMAAGHINPKTAESYLSDTVIRLALLHEDGISLLDWDQQSVDDLFDDIAVERDLADSTIYRQCRQLKSFLRYTKEFGLLAEVKLPFILSDYLAIRFRNTLLCPEKVQHTLLELYKNNTPECDIAWLLGALGFYAGHRTGESLALAISDVVIRYEPCDTLDINSALEPTEVWINIRRGKSYSASRSMPFHALAPKPIVKAFVGYVNERRKQFDGVNEKTIALIGTPGVAEPLKQTSATKVALTILRHCWGEAIDLHLLRHNFASWLLVRWQALFSMTLQYSYQISFPSLFETELQTQLKDHFGSDRLTKFEDQQHHMIEFANLMGHSNISVTLGTYIHTLHVIEYVRSSERCSIAS